jgi:hypothetical protein
MGHAVSQTSRKGMTPQRRSRMRSLRPPRLLSLEGRLQTIGAKMASYAIEGAAELKARIGGLVRVGPQAEVTWCLYPE